MQDKERKVMTIAEVAEELNLSPQGVRNLIHRGELPAAYLGNRYYIDREKFYAALEPDEIEFQPIVTESVKRVPNLVTKGEPLTEHDWRKIEDCIHALHGAIISWKSRRDHGATLVALMDTERTLRELFERNVSFGPYKDKAELLTEPIGVLDLNTRCYNALTKYAGVKTVGDITRMTEHECLQVRNLSESTLQHLKEQLARFGLELSAYRPRRHHAP